MGTITNSTLDGTVNGNSGTLMKIDADIREDLRVRINQSRV
jgi:hypothetical protein